MGVGLWSDITISKERKFTTAAQKLEEARESMGGQKISQRKNNWEHFKIRRMFVLFHP